MSFKHKTGHGAHGHCPGDKPSPTYISYATMLDRCHNPNSSRWAYYGARGIVVCERWRKSFEAFLSDMGERPDGRTLDRIDSNGNYEPGNCRWSTHAEQCQNRRSTKLSRELVERIRKEYAAGGVGYRPLAARYGVSHILIREVVKGRIWQ